MTTVYYQNAKTIFDFWRSNGLTVAQACGLLAQADAESSLNPEAVGDHGRAFGIDQWQPPRCKAIVEGCGIDLTKLPPLETQLKAALWEFKGPERHAFEAIRQQTTAYDAGFVACRLWERPASPAQWARRGISAHKWFEYFTSQPAKK